jgi:(4-(4-[2-(gamma-L-glutamylamino)ethyl]phenoxymethyl)furan-2-yl)methanamine synthase
VRAPLNGSWTALINENFATMADVHRILGDLLAGVDLMATADGREKSVPASRARLPACWEATLPMQTIKAGT